jgi:hypothetical protein
MMRNRHQRALSLVFWGVVVLAAIEGLSLLAIRLSRPFLSEEIRTTRDIFREQSKLIERLLDSQMLALDPVLGWRYRAGYRDSLNTINSQGLRGTRRYASQPPRGVVRVAAFGDAFVYGNDVADSAAWPALVERLVPRIEVLNYGVGGYGFDQAYLRFCSEGAALAPRIVVIGFVTDDLRDIVNVYRRFLSNRGIPFVKPRFMLDAGGQLVLLPNPLPRPSDYQRYLHSPERIVELGAHDYWYRPAIYQDPLYDYSATVRLLTNLWLRVEQRYFAPDRLLRRGEVNASSTAFRIVMRLFERFAAAVRAAGARPIVVLFPDRQALEETRRGRETTFAFLVRELGARGIEYVDLTPAFRDAPGGINTWFLPVGNYSRHYAPAGNRIIAQRLGRAFLALATAAKLSDAVSRRRIPPP